MSRSDETLRFLNLPYSDRPQSTQNSLAPRAIFFTRGPGPWERGWTKRVHSRSSAVVATTAPCFPAPSRYQGVTVMTYLVPGCRPSNRCQLVECGSLSVRLLLELFGRMTSSKNWNKPVGGGAGMLKFTSITVLLVYVTRRDVAVLTAESKENVSTIAILVRKGRRTFNSCCGALLIAFQSTALKSFTQVEKLHSPNLQREMYKWGSENW